MGKKEIIKIIRNSKHEMESHYGVQRLGLFGSYVREKQSKRSDIDLFYFWDLREYLEDQLHVKVDLVMESALKPAIGKRILSEVEYV